jgi:endonuclease/exonuclease/phosphatase family metal-dependent hydrolase
VNRPLRREFGDAIAAQEWDLALLQEAPPRWCRPLAQVSGASGVAALTSRNWAASLRTLLAEANPDLVASNEGGSNQLLVREPWQVHDVLRLTLARRPERRAMVLAHLRGPGEHELVVANLHASAHDRVAARREVIAAAETALDVSRGAPLLFGGDLNLRPAEAPEAFEELEGRFGFSPPTEPHSLDHLLVRGLEVIEPPHSLPASVREAPGPRGRVLQLSDHPCVAGAFGVK